jgi:heme-degrading monooxygenase HmoA
MVIVVWETWLNDGAEAEGLRITRQIWSDMQHVDGYISHQLLVDEDAANHLLLVSQWQTREAAVRSKDEYAGSEAGSKTVPQLKPLLSRERGRWVFSEDKYAEWCQTLPSNLLQTFMKLPESGRWRPIDGKRRSQTDRSYSQPVACAIVGV